MRIEGGDRQGLERLLRYCARPAFAQERLRQLDPEHLVYESKKPGPGGLVSVLLCFLVRQRVSFSVPARSDVMTPRRNLRAAIIARNLIKLPDWTMYVAYSLKIDSALPLPELTVLDEANPQVPDVSIRIEAVSPDGLPDGQQLGPFLWASPSRLWLQIPRVARFLVSHGNEILIDPEPGIDDDSLRVFLLGSAFGALLLQRGHLVLHGNAIRIGEQCMVCVGHSGAGKSTLAAGFMQRGYQVLADDVVPVDAQCRALPGFPRIKLWQDVADKLEIDTRALRRIRPNIEKYNLPVASDGAGRALPIGWVYILDSDYIDDLRIQPIQGLQRFQPLYSNTYRVRFLNGMALKPEHLKLCGKLASKIRLARISRSRGGFNLDQMIDTILADIAEHP